jgi:hypothetical protein
MTVIASIFGFLGSVVTSLFNFKGEQAKTVQNTLDLLKGLNDSDGQMTIAHAQALSALMTQGAYLERIWRPCLMFILMAIIGSYWFFGYIPPYFNQPMSPMMQEIFGLLKIGLGGYIPCRTIEKIVNTLQVGQLLRDLINKKVL